MVCVCKEGIDLRIDDGNDESGSLQLAGLILAIADGGAVDASTGFVTTTSQNSNSHEAAAE